MPGARGVGPSIGAFYLTGLHLAPAAIEGACAQGRMEFLAQGVDEMGKGDIRSRRGKIYNGSFGKTRPKDPARVKKRAAKKTAK